jgi:hypothetical protein
LEHVGLHGRIQEIREEFVAVALQGCGRAAFLRLWAFISARKWLEKPRGSPREVSQRWEIRKILNMPTNRTDV